MKKIFLLFCLTWCSAFVIAQEESKGSADYNPLTKFVGTWEADYIRTIDGEEKVFHIYYQGKPSKSGKGVRVVFYNTLDTILKDDWMEATYYYNEADKKIYALAYSSSSSVSTAVATIEKNGDLKIRVHKVGDDEGNYNLNTWSFPSDNEIVFEFTRWINFEQIDHYAYAKAKRIKDYPAE